MTPRRRLAVITGAGRGLGKSLVDEFSDAGWAVVALTRTPTTSVDRQHVMAATHDVRYEPTAELMSAIGNRPVDVLINNAAQGAPHAKLGGIAAAGVLNAVDVNVAGPLRLVQALLPQLLAAPAPAVINVTSRLGSVTAQARGDYSDLSTSYAYKISKAAQNMLTISLAQDLSGRVRCWAVHPGKLATGMGQADASKDPRVAARELRELLDSEDRTSPRFISLGAADLAW
ncbi:SDR family NAD(P)-dependent oxidoreductase [Arthrobacter sp. ISL-95]|uniref:SDR family NAD(P)-dependent oxidoreductase n=1 Tax=Arthrobacter sp. ISL-95 TaxID=2819116 RepID=UPI001BE656B4|nr:SDR family NAD(P)-dependent oxidoreductase [Arthrobacter sp. ISL-95]MBT2584464.1 SDR family NAD(P)-dependent oxidoreductase [Arthrobacter sp. ISL-95]